MSNSVLCTNINVFRRKEAISKLSVTCEKRLAPALTISPATAGPWRMLRKPLNLLVHTLPAVIKRTDVAPMCSLEVMTRVDVLRSPFCLRLMSCAHRATLSDSDGLASPSSC